jgi:hypothetical protein
MKKRLLIGLILLTAYSIGVVAFAFHFHPGSSEHINCSICHVVGSSEKAITQSVPLPADHCFGSIEHVTDSPVFRFLSASSPQRAPPIPA